MTKQLNVIGKELTIISDNASSLFRGSGLTKSLMINITSNSDITLESMTIDGGTIRNNESFSPLDISNVIFSDSIMRLNTEAIIEDVIFLSYKNREDTYRQTVIEIVKASQDKNKYMISSRQNLNDFNGRKLVVPVVFENNSLDDVEQYIEMFNHTQKCVAPGSLEETFSDDTGSLVISECYKVNFDLNIPAESQEVSSPEVLES